MPRALNKQQVEVRATLLKASKDPVLDKRGYINQNKTFVKYGLSPNSSSNRTLFRQIPGVFERLKPNIFRTRHCTGNSHIESMPMSQRIIDMGAEGWEMMQTPGVYAIVCKSTGNAYIGQSLRPDLRRANHLYCLKNYKTWFSSNIYFGNSKIAADIEEYGVEDFYIDIIESLPGATKRELKDAEIAFLTLHGLSKCYNNKIDGNRDMNSTRTPFTETDAECKRIFDLYSAAKKKLVWQKKDNKVFVKFRANATNVVNADRRSRRITAMEATIRRTVLAQQSLDRRKIVHDLMKEVPKLYHDYLARVEVVKQERTREKDDNIRLYSNGKRIREGS
jgi:group I intron endonuclease